MIRPNFDKSKKIEEILRVDHAGEYGAKVIYEGQLAATNNADHKKQIKDMYQHELVHLEYFEEKMRESKVKPTILMPLWRKFGYAMGYITAKMGYKQAMICTDSVEDVIEKHYTEQINYLEGVQVKANVIPDLSRDPDLNLAQQKILIGSRKLAKYSAGSRIKKVRDDVIPELKEKITQFRQEELGHKKIANNYTKNLNFRDQFLSLAIKSICKVAIGVSKRV